MNWMFPWTCVIPEYFCRSLLVDAHKEYLDEREVDFEQLLGLCQKLASVQTTESPKAHDSGVGKAATGLSETPQALDRGLLRQMEMDFDSSGSELEVEELPDAPSAGRHADGPPPTTVHAYIHFCVACCVGRYVHAHGFS